MKHLYFTLFFIFFLAFKLSSQDKLAYKEDFPDHVTINPYFSSKNITLTFKPTEAVPDISAFTARYAPDTKNTFGTSFSYNDFELSVGFRLPRSTKHESVYGHTNYFDLDFKFIIARFVPEISYSRIKGFADLNTPAYSPDDDSNSPYLLRSDLLMRRIKGKLTYIFMPDKFSYNAAFSFTERQLKSGGTFLLSGELFALKIAGDTAILPGPVQGAYASFQDLTRATVTGLNIMPGASYTLAKDGFFANGTLRTGIELQRHRHRFSSTDSRFKEARVAFVAQGRIAAGYNRPRFFAAVSYAYDFSPLSPSPIKIRTHYRVLEVHAGIRFDIFGHQVKQAVN